MANFGGFWPKWAKQEFFQKALGTFLSRLQALTNWKVSEKSNEHLLRNCVTYERTDGRDSLGLQRLRRETKNYQCLMNRLGKNAKPSIFGHFWPKWVK